MAHQPARALYSVLGWVVWGDLGPVTLYRDHQGKIVSYAKTWPADPASDAQLAQRARYTAAAAAWQALTPPQRRQWELATRRGSLCLGGYALYVHWSTTHDDKAIHTLERQTHTTLLD